MNSTELMDIPICKLSSELYREIRKLPTQEGDFTDQALKSSLSVGSNVCEAYGRRRDDKPQDWHMRIARGSAYELAFQLHAAGYVKLCKLAHKLCDLLDGAISDASEPSKETESSPLYVIKEGASKKNA